ncbi:MAG: DUF1905 domain-containing protein [Bdellovibrionales bacterium]|nr:DUF1905 domain-containing protein [Bdellovibrionales bacterium]
MPTRKKPAATHAPKDWIEVRSKIGMSDYLPGMHYLEVPASVVKKFAAPFKTRLDCESENKKGSVRFSCGMMPLGKGTAYIMMSKARMKVLGLRLGDPIHFRIKPNKSRFGMDMPPELKEVLKQDPEANRRFLALTPGKQRNIIFYVSTTKNPDLRIDRSIRLLENLKALPEGKEPMHDIMKGPAPEL